MSASRAWRVDLHCHSSFSDGTLVPEQVAEELAAAGCGHAALTDHNTTEGLERFREALERHGIRMTSGVEIDARTPSGLVHLLAYGFDEHDRHLQKALHAVRHPHTGKLRRTLTSSDGKTGPRIETLAPGQGAIDAGDAIKLLHDAGGKVFLAHPLTLTADWDQLEAAVAELRQLGLDGIEAHYKPYSRETRRRLVELAARHGLLCSGGSDFHGPGSGLGSASSGMDLPEETWYPLARELGITGRHGGNTDPAPAGKPRQLRSFLLNIGLPAALAGLLFVLTLFLVFLPAMEAQLLDRKKETIRELTRTAASILQEYHDESVAGLIEPDQARQEAAARIGRLRYGEEGKDYFWITDMRPYMVMHPYRGDLNGTDLGEFRDPAGNPVFVAFVDAVRERESGYVDYYWQWKDDPEQIAPKLSYVQAFRPWGWVIGTGIYTEDLREEVSRTRISLVLASILISAVVALLLLYVARQSYRLELRRARAEIQLSESSEKYRALVSASTEGTLMVLDGECAYANAMLESMLGYQEGALGGRPVLDLLASETPLDRSARESIDSLLAGEPAPESFEAGLLRNDGQRIDVQLSATSITFAGREGIILVARDITRSTQVEAALERSRVHYRKLTRSIPLGVFRARWQDGRSPLAEANPAMHKLLGLSADSHCTGIDWLARIQDEELRRRVVSELAREGSLEIERLALRRDDGSSVDVRLFTVLVEEDAELLCDGVLEDITERTRGEAERDELIAQLQTSLFYLQEPIGPAVREAPQLELEESIAEAAARMSHTKTSALVVVSSSGEPIGLVTDQDFRARVTARDLDRRRPIREIMSAPLASISEHGLVHEAILEMQERGIGHLAVLDDSGRLRGLVRDRDLIQFRHYSSLVLAHSIRHAASIEELSTAVKRLPRLVQALIASGARIRAINRIISRVADSVVERLLQMAHEELGPAPCRYAFVAMGSEGRREQTLLTDQDTGLIHENPPPGKEEAWAEWFLAFGTWMSKGLAKAGYRECPGGVMASNKQWNGSREQWSRQFGDWIRSADSQQLLDINIAFDLRCIGGDPDLVHEVRRRVFEVIESHPPFLLHLARNALLTRPPLGIRGNIVLHTEEDGSRTISLKEALMPVVNYGRLYALKHRLEETHTIDRLGQLHALGRLSSESWDRLLPDYEEVMKLRLNRQAAALLAGQEANNRIGPDDWNAHQEATLKRLFALTGDLRKKISYEFLGMA